MFREIEIWKSNDGKYKLVSGEGGWKLTNKENIWIIDCTTFDDDDEEVKKIRLRTKGLDTYSDSFIHKTPNEYTNSLEFKLFESVSQYDKVMKREANLQRIEELKKQIAELEREIQ